MHHSERPRASETEDTYFKSRHLKHYSNCIKIQKCGKVTPLFQNNVMIWKCDGD